MDLWFALGQIICLIALAIGGLISFKHSDLKEAHAAQIPSPFAIYVTYTAPSCDNVNQSTVTHYENPIATRR